MNTSRNSGERKTRRYGLASAVRRLLQDERGQTLPVVAVAMTALLAISGMVIDSGHAYVVQSQLQNSTNAAALAAAQFVYTSNTATINTVTQADQFGETDNPNSYVTAPPVVQPVCVNLLMPAGSTCTANSVANAVRVTETASVKTFFMGMFGRKQLSVSAFAMSSMLGGEAQPWNVAILLDSTGSMNFSDPNCGTGMTEFTCATGAIQAMLGAASPCKPGYATCPTSNSNLRIALFSFPGVSTTSVTADTVANCSATPSFMAYTLPTTNSTSDSPLAYTQSNGHGGTTTWTATYEIVPFSSDYYSPTATNHLNTNSTLVSAVTGCMTPIVTGNSGTPGGIIGSYEPGGATYFAAPIYAAQAALLAEQAANPGSKNALILLSDGQANVTSYPGGNFPSQQGASLLTSLAGLGLTALTGTGLYPDVNDECQQAIMAAQSAANAGTRVYAVSYGAEAQGCSYLNPMQTDGSYGTDNTTVATGRNASFTAASITPCITMENIASNLSYFYSDFNQSDAGTGPDRNCIDNAHPVTSLNDILLSVLSDFLRPRLLPYTASYVVVTA